MVVCVCVCVYGHSFETEFAMLVEFAYYAKCASNPDASAPLRVNTHKRKCRAVIPAAPNTPHSPPSTQLANQLGLFKYLLAYRLTGTACPLTLWSFVPTLD